MSMESPSCMSDSLLAMAMAAYLQQRQRTASYRENVSFLFLAAVELTSDRCWLLLCRPPALFFDHSRTTNSPRKGGIAQSCEFTRVQSS